MKHDKASGQIQETAALYALGSLSQHEVRAFELHLQEGCSVCEAELKRFENTVAGIGFGASEAEPPGYLRDLLAARIEREPHAAPSLLPPPPLPSPKVEAEPNGPVVTPVVPPPARIAPPRPTRNYIPWSIAASLAAAALLSFYFWRQAEDKTNLERQQTAAVREDSEQLRGALELERGRTRELEQINEALTSPRARVIVLAGQPAAPSATAAIFWNVQRNQWVVNSRLPSAPAGKTYQLWFVTATGRISAGLIKTDSVGHGFTVLEVPPDIKLAAIAITLEPEGGSTQPTMPIYALGNAS